MSPHNNQASTASKTLDEKQAYSIPGRPYALYSSLPYYFTHLQFAFAYFAMIYLKNPYWSLLVLYLVIPLLDWAFP